MGQKTPFTQTTKMETGYESVQAEPKQNEGRIDPRVSYLDNRADGGSLGEIEQLLERADLHFAQDQIDYAVDDLISAAGRLRDTNEQVHRAYTEAISKLTMAEGKTDQPQSQSRALSLIKARNTLPI